MVGTRARASSDRSDRETDLTRAVSQGDLTTVLKCLDEQRMDVNTRNRSDMTLLDLAHERGQREVKTALKHRGGVYSDGHTSDDETDGPGGGGEGGGEAQVEELQFDADPALWAAARPQSVEAVAAVVAEDVGAGEGEGVGAVSAPPGAGADAGADAGTSDGEGKEKGTGDRLGEGEDAAEGAPQEHSAAPPSLPSASPTHGDAPKSSPHDSPSDSRDSTSSSRRSSKRNSLSPEAQELTRAVCHDDVETVSRLIDEGADVNTTNAAGLTLLDLARERKKQAVGSLLRLRGAKYANGRGSSVDASEEDGLSFAVDPSLWSAPRPSDFGGSSVGSGLSARRSSGDGGGGGRLATPSPTGTDPALYEDEQPLAVFDGENVQVSVCDEQITQGLQ